jgi:glycosyltransferase involved in cell wall biosynthesis
VSSPALSVIIPARDAADTLPDTLGGLRAQTFGGRVEVVLVDDGSRDATAAIARSSGLVDRVLPGPGAGPAGARNAGAAAARAPALAFLDADCRPAPAWLEAGVKALERAELVLGETRPRPDRRRGPFDRTLSVVGLSPLFESANLFVRRTLFEQLGGFENWLGPPGGKELAEDVWFGWRARRAGARIESSSAALAYHEVFSRGAAEYAGERWRLRFFPAIVRRVPELRHELLWGGVFLNARTAKFDAALAGLALAAMTRRPGLAAAAAAGPYVRALSWDARGAGGLGSVPVQVAADAVGLAAMLIGAARYRSLLL